MKKYILGIILVGLVFLTACKDNGQVGIVYEVKTAPQLCPDKYIPYTEGYCCLDENSNSICDKDEKKAAGQPAKATGAATLCSDECSADTCDDKEYISCLTQSDGCKDEVNRGRIIDKCGVECLRDSDCRSDKECDGSKCRNTDEPICTPKTCLNLGYECGTWNNGCGSSIDCGNCDTDESCKIGVCAPQEIGATFIRELPTKVTSGETFTVTYRTADASGNWGVLIEDDIAGSCKCNSCSNPTHIATGWLSPIMHKEVTIIATGPGSCVFNGDYQFASRTTYPAVVFPQGRVTVTTEEPTQGDGPTLTMQLPSQVNTGSAFNMNLVVADSSGNYGVLYTVDIAGGCTSAAGNTHIAGGFIDETDTTNAVNIKAPSSAGACTFTGDYQFADGSGEYPVVGFPQKTVVIG